MAITSQILIDVPVPIGIDHSTETDWGWLHYIICRYRDWEELNRWVRLTEDREAFTADLMEIRNRRPCAFGKG